jgi:RimJ/RimL family protein N-acetyltransferase
MGAARAGGRGEADSATDRPSIAAGLWAARPGGRGRETVATAVPGGVGLLRQPEFPSLTVSTPRLHVRPLVRQDAAGVTVTLADRQTQRWLPYPVGQGPTDGLAWCTELAEERRHSGTGDHYGIVRREDDRLVGLLWTRRTDWMARSTEAAYAVSAEARGFGVAAEALDVLAIALLLEHDFQRIEMRVAPGNTASRRVAEKAGFVYEGLLRNAGHVHSGRVDLEMWSMVVGDLRS